MARSTWDGSVEPAVHAEPDEAAIPALFRPLRIASPSAQSKAMLEVLGRRLSRSPLTKQSLICAEHAGLEAVAQGFHAGLLNREVFRRKLRRDAQRHDGGHILRAAAPTAFLPAAADQCVKAHALADVKHADPLGCMQLMAGQRQHVDFAWTGG